MVEDSILDNAGYFMLIIITKLSENACFSKLIFKAECQLFKRRLREISSYNMRILCKKIIRYLKKQEQLHQDHVPVQIVCQHLILKHMAQHICSHTHSVCCNEHSIKIPFKHCLPLIARRLVELNEGVATLNCGLWKKLLEILFTKQLSHRLYKINVDQVKKDPRIMEVLNKIKNDAFPTLFNIEKTVLTHNEVDGISRRFPPCMLNLQQQLRTKHRLSHTQRFYYSLFLKDIGMPVEEAVEFWKKEYRLNPIASKCCHHWEVDEKKYLYGIRHMYGLEGAKKNYTSVSCYSIQNASNACSEGGCPFKSFELEKVMQLLDIKDENFLSQINELRNVKKYSKACELYLYKSSKHENQIDLNLTPVNFYMAASTQNA